MKSWNEIRKAATAFSKRWKGAYDEKSQAQSFLKEFFEVFGVDTVTQATFEHRVKFSDGSQGFVDCFWPSTILVEMKSKGKDLDAAYSQAMDYVRTMCDGGMSVGSRVPRDCGGAGRAALPRAIVVSDFQTFRFYDLTKDGQLTTFKLADLRKYVTLFGYMIGGESEEIREQDPVNRKAAEKMAKLHDALKAIGYAGRELEVYLVRLLFCLFAEDTQIFKPNQFSTFVRERTAADGSDLAAKIAELFQVLNTREDARLKTRDEEILKFPYVNGNLFGEQLQIPAFSAAMRTALLECGELDWSKISPAIFGAMFQGVMDETKRHDLGAHYTSEENILKVIRPLFLDRLREEFEVIVGKSHAEVSTGLTGLTGLRGGSANPVNLVNPVKESLRPPRTLREKKIRLEQFHDRIAALRFLDPACGCGNFLLIAYRELRRLEMDVLEELHKDDPGMVLDVSTLCKVNVSQFYGIEIEQFPAEIAKVALWLMDHLCNLEVADRFGQYFARIPIKASPHIVCANALTMDWRELLNGDYGHSGVEFVKVTADCDFKMAKSHLQDLKRGHAFVQNGEGTRFRFTNQVMKALSDKARDQSVDRKVHWAAVANIERLCEKSVSLWNEKPRNGSEDIDHYAKHGCPFVLGGVTYVAKITSKAYPSEDSLATYSVEAISVEKNLARGIADAISKKQHLDPSDENRILKFVEAVKGASKPFDFIFGNPPFLGKKEQSAEQKEQLRALFTNSRVAGNLDFVTGWYRKAASYLHGTSTECAFVSTNSITQGEQVPLLWKEIPASINFGYRTFKWHNEAKGNAAVHCVIIGFAEKPRKEKLIFNGDSVTRAGNINAYLVDAPNVLIESHAQPVRRVVDMFYGSMPIDNGFLILEPSDRNAILAEHPEAASCFRVVSGGDEYLNNKERYCLWLVDADPSVWLKVPQITERVKSVKAFREASNRAATVKLAATPSLFGEIRQPKTDYLIIPKVSSENREYIPIGFMSPEVIATGSALIVPNATTYHFGILTSRMHNAWMRAVAGRMKSDYQYSKNIVFNNFIWPEATDDQQVAIAAAAQGVLDARKSHLPARTLASLYNPLAMPPDLLKAHQHLDALVDKAYGKKFASDAERVAHLFDLYAQAVK